MDWLRDAVQARDADVLNKVTNLVYLLVDPVGIEPTTLPCHGRMLPVYHGPIHFILT